MLGATLLFVFGKRLVGGCGLSVGKDATTAAIVGASIFELAVAVCGGYFGGGVGIEAAPDVGAAVRHPGGRSHDGVLLREGVQVKRLGIWGSESDLRFKF